MQNIIMLLIICGIPVNIFFLIAKITRDYKFIMYFIKFLCLLYVIISVLLILKHFNLNPMTL